MNKEQEEFMMTYTLEINDYIARITSKIDNKIIDTWEISKKDILKALNFRDNLIEYLEKESKKVYRDGGIRQNIFLDILERVKSGKYD